MKVVNYEYKIYEYRPDMDNKTGRPIAPFRCPVMNVVSIEKSANGMQEILTTKDGEVHTIDLKGVYREIIKEAKPEDVATDSPATEAIGDANVPS